ILILILSGTVSLAQQASEPPEYQGNIQKDESPAFASFTLAIKNTNNVELQWKMVSNIADGDYFVVEKGSDGNHFETLSALKIADTANAYTLTDNSASNGTDFYRVKFISKSGTYIYSKVLQANLSAAVDFKFYPNPADKLIIIKTSHNVDID